MLLQELEGRFNRYTHNDGFHTFWLAANEQGSLAHEIDGIDTSPYLFTL